MYDGILVGSRVPKVKLGYLQNGQIASVSTHNLFANQKTVVMGVPGAFTPVCAHQHVPDFIANAPKMRAAGFTQIICLAPNDPFVVDVWQSGLDPAKTIQFLSDGNLDFCTALNLAAPAGTFFMGRRSQRYVLIVHDLVIQRVRIEPGIVNMRSPVVEDALELH